MPAYYNENDTFAASCLRFLSTQDVIAPGHVDTRSIVEVRPQDLADFSQCHFFAGGGLWSVAARIANWPDSLNLWTVSCPCQPFSVAGKNEGFNDPRHLWPYAFRLIRARRPAFIVGEQVAKKSGLRWFDGVASDLEAIGYACRAVSIPSCAVNAPHERERLYFVAMADSDCTGLALGQIAEIERRNLREKWAPIGTSHARNNYWRNWESSTDYGGRSRRAKPGTRLLVDGFPARMDQWRVAGNAINPQLASVVISSLLEEVFMRETAPYPFSCRVT